MLGLSVGAVRVPVFFFQAGDGIRDDLVTGVQTCALPIFEIFVELSIGWQDVILERIRHSGTQSLTVGSWN